MKHTFLTSFGLFAALAHAATIEVKVGPNLSYSPNSVIAKQGDVVNFKFGSGHDVVSGSFDSPCQPDGKIYSGAPNDGDIFSVTINGTSPIWIYCSVPHHCQSGMAMVINPPSDKTIDNYKSAAANTGSSSTPDNVTGGVFGGASSSSSSSSSFATGSASASASLASASTSAASRSSSSTGTATSSASAHSSSSAASPKHSAEVSGFLLLGMVAFLALHQVTHVQQLCGL